MTAGLKILPTMGLYAATKNAVRTISDGTPAGGWPHLRVTKVSPGIITTDFLSSINDPASKATTETRMATLAIPPEAIGRGIAYAIEPPENVDVGSIVIRPTAQD